MAAVPAVLRVALSAALSRAWHSQHGHLDWIAKQCSPLTCELERLYDWAALYHVDRLGAATASGSALATGNVGTPLLVGTAMRGQNGLDYTVQAAVELGAAPTAVTVRCAAAGSAGNLAAGQTLTLIDPVPGCSGTLTVGAGGISGGAEEEKVDDWRLRVAEEWQVVTKRGARSGKPDDYRYWARSAHPSVSGALVQPHALGVGTVLVRPICNALESRQPTQGVLDAVAAYLYSVAPATSDWRLAAPLVRPVNVSIDLQTPVDSAENRAAIQGALASIVLAEMSESSVLTPAEIDVAIATVTSAYTRIAPMSDIAVSAGEVLVLVPVAWI
nr:baseplate J/gp47 family protein [Rhodocyclus gracilis]